MENEGVTVENEGVTVENEGVSMVNENDLPVTEEEQGAEDAAFCSNCGNKLSGDTAFCPKCGTARNAVAAAPQGEKKENGSPLAKQKSNGKVKIIVAGAVAAVVVVVACALLFGGLGKKDPAPDFQAIYDQYCDARWAEVGGDGSYLYIDTNPSDSTYGEKRYLLVANRAIKDVNAALGFSDSVYVDMDNTSSSMGKQSETKNGVMVTWTYHPKYGLEVTYKLDSSESSK